MFVHRDGQVIYVTAGSTHMRVFSKILLPKIRHKFVLITAGKDMSMPMGKG